MPTFGRRDGAVPRSAACAGTSAVAAGSGPPGSGTADRSTEEHRLGRSSTWSELHDFPSGCLLGRLGAVRCLGGFGRLALGLLLRRLGRLDGLRRVRGGGGLRRSRRASARHHDPRSRRSAGGRTRSACSGPSARGTGRLRAAPSGPSSIETPAYCLSRPAPLLAPNSSGVLDPGSPGSGLPGACTRASSPLSRSVPGACIARASPERSFSGSRRG